MQFLPAYLANRSIRQNNPNTFTNQLKHIGACQQMRATTATTTWNAAAARRKKNKSFKLVAINQNVERHHYDMQMLILWLRQQQRNLIATAIATATYTVLLSPDIWHHIIITNNSCNNIHILRIYFFKIHFKLQYFAIVMTWWMREN